MRKIQNCKKKSQLAIFASCGGNKPRYLINDQTDMHALAIMRRAVECWESRQTSVFVSAVSKLSLQINMNIFLNSFIVVFYLKSQSGEARPPCRRSLYALAIFCRHDRPGELHEVIDEHRPRTCNQTITFRFASRRDPFTHKPVTENTCS